MSENVASLRRRAHQAAPRSPAAPAAATAPISGPRFAADPPAAARLAEPPLIPPAAPPPAPPVPLVGAAPFAAGFGEPGVTEGAEAGAVDAD